MGMEIFTFGFDDYVGGAIMHRTTAAGVTSRTAFRDTPDDDIYLVDVALTWVDTPDKWTTFSHSSAMSPTRTVGARTEAGQIVINDEEYPQLATAVPAYAQHVVVKQLLAGAEAKCEVQQFDEDTPTNVYPLIAERAGSESVTLLDGSSVTADRVQIYQNGTPTNVYWAQAGQIIKVDWSGAQSYASTAADLLNRVSDPEVTALIREFLDQ